MSFLYGIIFIIFLLVVSVFIRRKIRKLKLKKYKNKGGNSRESFGENIVAVLSSDKKKKHIKENWIDKFDRMIRGNNHAN